MSKTARLLTIPSLLVCFFFLFSLSVSADSLTIAPARQEIELKTADSTTSIFKIYNHGDTPVSGTLKIVDFIVNNDQGIPEFLEDQTLSSDYAAATWIKLPYQRLTIPANDKVEFQFTINSPATALPGGHYAAIIFETTTDINLSPLSNQAQALTSSRLASLLYINIPGSYEESALISFFKAPKFSQNGPITLTTKILNLSPIHLRPQGVITITNIFGDVIAHLNLEESNIFPQTERSYQNTLPTKWLAGRFRADLYSTYGTQGKTLQATTYFTVFPVMVILYIVIIIIALYYIFTTLNRRGKHQQHQLETEISKLKQELDQIEKQS